MGDFDSPRGVSILEVMQIVSSSKPLRMILELSDESFSKKHYSKSTHEILTKTHDFFYCIGRAVEMSKGYEFLKRGTYKTFRKWGFEVHRLDLENLLHERSGKKYNYRLTYFTR